MKKRVYGRKLSRESSSRRALFRSLVRALVISGKIKTTYSKAKAIQADVDKLMNLAKDGSLAARRRLYSVLGNDRIITDYLVKKIAPVFSDIKSGYTKLVNLPARVGDRSKVVALSWSKEIEKMVDIGKSVKARKILKKKALKKQKNSKKDEEKKGLSKISKILKKK